MSRAFKALLFIFMSFIPPRMTSIAALTHIASFMLRQNASATAI